MSGRVPRWRPRAPSHRGVVSAKSCWIPDLPADPRERRVRLLALWEPGCSLRRGPGGILCRWPRERRLDTRTGLMPLVSDRGRLVSAPLHPSDIDETKADAIVLLWGGRLLEIDENSLIFEDPSRWLDLGAWTVERTDPLGEPPPPLPMPPDRVTDARVILGGPRSERLQLPAPGGGSPGLSAGLSAGAGQVFARVGRLVQRAPLPEFVKRQGSFLERWGERLGLSGALSAMFGLQHAQYIRDLMMRLEDEDWLGALDQAIPLKGSGSSLFPPSTPALDWLKAPTSTDFRSSDGPSAPSVGLATDLYDRLGQMYRRALEALKQSGRHREVAYVLAELLGEVEQALSYLEEHKQYPIAAELGEAKSVDPARLVALWLQAKEPERALQIARLYQAFGAAVELLERRQQGELADGLRLSWARREMSAGRYADAIEVLAPIANRSSEASELLQVCLPEAVCVGGIAGARALGRAISLAPARLGEWEIAASEIISEGGEGMLSLAEHLPAFTACRPIAERLARSLAIAAPGLPSASERLRALLLRAQDPAFLADLPALAEPARPRPLIERTEPIEVEIQASEGGDDSALDVLWLPKGRELVARGELGARLYGPRGLVASLAHPTHHIVPSADRRIVLLVGRRGRSIRVARFDTVTRKLARWGEIETSLFAERFGAPLWFVAQGDSLVGLDPHAPQPVAVFRVPLPRIVGMSDQGSVLNVVARTERPEIVECFTFSLPSLRCSARRDLPWSDRHELLAVGEASVVSSEGIARWQASSPAEAVPLPGAQLGAALSGPFAALVAKAPEGVVVTLRKAAGKPEDRPLVRMLFAKSSSVSVRLQEGLLVAIDDRGRSRGVDLATGAVLVRPPAR